MVIRGMSGHCLVLKISFNIIVFESVEKTTGILARLEIAVEILE